METKSKTCVNCLHNIDGDCVELKQHIWVEMTSGHGNGWLKYIKLKNPAMFSCAGWEYAGCAENE